MINLLNLPLELPPESPAKVTEDDTFLTGLPEYLSRCACSHLPTKIQAHVRLKVKPLKAEYLVLQIPKPMVPTRFAPSHVYA